MCIRDRFLFRGRTGRSSVLQLCRHWHHIVQLYDANAYRVEGHYFSQFCRGKKQPVVDGFDNWYDWRVSNWGTKWELCEFFGIDLQDPEDSDEATISFSCQSAWSPPLGALEYFDMNTECSVKCSYYEGGMDFMGIWSSDEGDRCWSISETAPRSDDPWWGTPEGIELDGDFGITETMAHYEEEQENEGARKTRELVVEKKAQNMEEA